MASHEVTSVFKCFLCGVKSKVAADVCMHMLLEHKLFLTTGVRPEESELTMKVCFVSSNFMSSFLYFVSFPKYYFRKLRLILMNPYQ